jgi:hypothetical protein
MGLDFVVMGKDNNGPRKSDSVSPGRGDNWSRNKKIALSIIVLIAIILVVISSVSFDNQNSETITQSSQQTVAGGSSLTAPEPEELYYGQPIPPSS